MCSQAVGYVPRNVFTVGTICHIQHLSCDILAQVKLRQIWTAKSLLPNSKTGNGFVAVDAHTVILAPWVLTTVTYIGL